MQDTAPLGGKAPTTKHPVGTGKPLVTTGKLGGAGKTVGRYVLLRQIGRGGGGRVFAAFDSVLDRNVALKQLWEHAGSAEDIVREGRLLARLSHPSVVTIHDIAFGEDGEVFLAMELVEGQDFAAWVPQRRRSKGGPAEIIRALLDAGAGVAAAHRAGIVHGDIKPSNILVDAEGRARVTDFGVARIVDSAWDRDALEASSKAGPRSPAAGTPAYMAPEQHAGHPADPASDQYSFCLTAWEALDGEYPFELEPTEREAAATFTGSAPATGPLDFPWERLAMAKEHWRGGTKAGRLSARWQRALLRGLDADPTKRWPSMESLLEELRPVRSRRLGVLVAGGAALGLAGLVATVVQGERRCGGAELALGDAWDDARRASVQASMLAHEVGYAAQTWARTSAELDAFAEHWTTSYTDACEATRVREEQSTELMDLRMACLRSSRQQFIATTEVLVELDDKGFARSDRVVATLPDPSHCDDLDALRAEVAQPPADEIEKVARIREGLARSKALRGAGRVSDARAALQAASSLAEGIVYEPVRVEILVETGVVEELIGDYDAAKSAFDDAVVLATKLGMWERALRAQGGLVYVVGSRQHRPKEAAAYLPIIEGLIERLGNAAEERGHLLAHRSAIAYENADFDTALALEKQALALFVEAEGERSSSTVLARRRIANTYRSQGNLEPAEEEFRAIIELQADWLGEHHPDVAETRCDRAQVLYRMGDYAGSERAIREALPALEALLGESHPQLLGYRATMAEAIASQDRNADAEAEFRKILKLIGDGPGPEAEVRNGLGNLLESQGRLDEAEAEHRKVAQLFSDTLGPEHVNVAISKHNLGSILAQRGLYEEAETQHLEALRIIENALGKGHPQVGLVRLNLGRMYKNQSLWAKAEAQITAAIEILDAALGAEHPQTAEARAVAQRLAEDRTDGPAGRPR